MDTNACLAFNDFLFRRSPNWFPKQMAKDRQPWSFGYLNMWPQSTWPSFLGTTLHWNKIHVTRPNDTGCWTEMDSDACAQPICDPERLYTGWGVEDNTYGKFHRDYQTPVWCYDQLRHVTDARQQLAAIVDGHRMMSKEIMSDFLKLLSIKQADKLHICGSAGTTVDVTPTMFTNNCTRIDLGSSGNLPTSELTMNYLDNHIENLMYNGYFDMEFLPTGKFAVTSDITTQRRLSNNNPALSQMYSAADFVKGGKFYAFGVMSGVGNWLFKIDEAPFRYQHLGNGVLQRIWPFENVATTVGKKPVFSEAYKNARYQFFHVHNRNAREVYVGDTTPIGEGMTFNTARDMMGRWSWKSPDYFNATDPNTGEVCAYQNDKKNKGYWLAEFEVGMRTIYPEIEMWILAEREPQPVFNEVPCASEPTEAYQSLVAYNPWCGDEEPA